MRCDKPAFRSNVGSETSPQWDPDGEKIGRHSRRNRRVWGGGTFAPWRGVFLSRGTPHRMICLSPSCLNLDEINGTPSIAPDAREPTASGASEVHDGFVFSSEAPAVLHPTGACFAEVRVILSH